MNLLFMKQFLSSIKRSLSVTMPPTVLRCVESNGISERYVTKVVQVNNSYEKRTFKVKAFEESLRVR
jgi:hypothetical protein